MKAHHLKEAFKHVSLAGQLHTCIRCFTVDAAGTETIGDKTTLCLFCSACLVWLFFDSREHCENNSEAKLDNHKNAHRLCLIGGTCRFSGALNLISSRSLELFFQVCWGGGVLSDGRM